MAAKESLRSRRARAANVVIAADRPESGPGAPAVGDLLQERGDEIALRREITIDRTRRDAGAGRDSGDLHRRHATFARHLPRRRDDRIVARG